MIIIRNLYEKPVSMLNQKQTHKGSISGLVFICLCKHQNDQILQKFLHWLAPEVFPYKCLWALRIFSKIVKSKCMILAIKTCSLDLYSYACFHLTTTALVSNFFMCFVYPETSLTNYITSGFKSQIKMEKRGISKINNLGDIRVCKLRPLSYSWKGRLQLLYHHWKKFL